MVYRVGRPVCGTLLKPWELSYSSGIDVISNLEMLLEAVISLPIAEPFLRPLVPTVKSHKGLAPHLAAKVLKMPMGLENVLERLRVGFYVDSDHMLMKLGQRIFRKRCPPSFHIWFDEHSEAIALCDSVERIFFQGYGRIVRTHLADEATAPISQGARDCIVAKENPHTSQIGKIPL